MGSCDLGGACPCGADNDGDARLRWLARSLHVDREGEGAECEGSAL